MELTKINTEAESADVSVVTLGQREFIVIGTAHISQESADLVRRVITQTQPDCVCVELDEQRYKTLSDRHRWESLNLREIIRRKQLTTLLVNLMLSSYQKRLGQKLGVMPGLELLEATNVAKEQAIPVSLCDRDVRITLRRAWGRMSWWEKLKMTASLGVISFDSPELSEEVLAEMRQKDVVTELMRELGEVMPVLKTVLLDERDTYLAQKIRHSEGDKIVAVVGAGHVEGILHALEQPDRDLSEFEQIPPASPIWKVVGWAIPLLIIAAIGYIGWTQGAQAATDNLIYWVLINSIPSAIGGLIAFGHPVTILTALVAAPFTSLTPLIGVGYLAAFVQAYFQPPLVKELQTVGDEVNQWRKWWQNKLLRILLVFILTSLGSMLGTYAGAYEIISNLFA